MSAAAHPHELVDEGALTVAMAIAPGVYARNRMFAFYKHPGVARARARAATLRGMAGVYQANTARETPQSHALPG